MAAAPRALIASEPFVFFGSLELLELLPHEAHDARELGEQLERVPEESVFCHTSLALSHRPALPDAYSNDFAAWVGYDLRDRRLAERLAAVDPFQSGSMERVRQDLVATITDHLQHLPAAPSPPLVEPFRFFQAHLVPVPTGQEARTLAEFRDALADADVSVLFYHIINARYRLGRGRGDFVEWIQTALGLPELGERLAHIDPYIGSMERIRDRYLGALNEVLEREPRQ
jgi:hypothetical protein